MADPVERAVQLYQAGATTRSVAARLHVHESTIRRWLTQQGLPRRSRGPRPDPAALPRAARRRQQRRAVYERERGGPLDARTRRRILRLLQHGKVVNVAEAAQAVGVEWQRIWAAARLLPQWREQLVDAVPCIAGDASGTPAGWRRRGCRCQACRASRKEILRRDGG